MAEVRLPHLTDNTCVSDWLVELGKYFQSQRRFTLVWRPVLMTAFCYVNQEILQTSGVVFTFIDPGCAADLFFGHSACSPTEL